MTKKSTTEGETTLGKAPAVKSEHELQSLRTLSRKAILSGGTLVACWFKDNGGADQCICMDSGDCTNAGGVATAAPCPNAFHDLRRLVYDLHGKIETLQNSFAAHKKSLSARKSAPPKKRKGK
jgi:hypothetical protein